MPVNIADKLASLIALIRNMANNLNQIARHTNTIKRVSILDLVKVRKIILNLETRLKNFIHSPPSASHGDQVNEPERAECQGADHGNLESASFQFDLGAGFGISGEGGRV